eukprot:scaffold4757_cov28-Tisochrysis_lutea.AAC.5
MRLALPIEDVDDAIGAACGKEGALRGPEGSGWRKVEGSSKGVRPRRGCAHAAPSRSLTCGCHASVTGPLPWLLGEMVKSFFCDAQDAVGWGTSASHLPIVLPFHPDRTSYAPLPFLP